jgi:putative tricarboxylic transport membrane protein
VQSRINITDVFTGLLLSAIALVALALSWHLRLGTAFRMGPGYVPQLLCYLQIALGAAVAISGLTRPGEPLETWVLRPIVLVLAGVVFFALTIERLGLVVAVTGMVVISCLANRETKVWEAVLLGAGLAAFSVLVFVTGLRLPILVLPEFRSF